MAPAKRDAVLKEVTNAPDLPRDEQGAAGVPGIFKQRPNTVQTFSRRKRLDQVWLVTLSQVLLLLPYGRVPTLLSHPQMQHDRDYF